VSVSVSVYVSVSVSVSVSVCREAREKSQAKTQAKKLLRKEKWEARQATAAATGFFLYFFRICFPPQGLAFCKDKWEAGFFPYVYVLFFKDVLGNFKDNFEALELGTITAAACIFLLFFFFLEGSFAFVSCAEYLLICFC
jgi:hypothetical protein